MTPPAVREFYAHLGITLPPKALREAPARCFAAPDAHHHGDRTPSTSVNLTTGAWYCHACGAHGGAYDAALLRGLTPRAAMELLIAYGLAHPRRAERPSRARRAHTSLPPAGQPARTPVITESQIAQHAQRLQNHHELLHRLELERGITATTLTRFGIGLDAGRITIPVRAADGLLVGLLRWLPFDRRDAVKMIAAPGSKRDLFPPPESIDDTRLVLCEGEPDAIAAHSAGVAAVAIPGVTGWRPGWTMRFHAREIIIALDCDQPGRTCAKEIATDLKAAGIDASVLDLAPDRDDGYDLTDHFLTSRRPSDPTQGRPATPTRPLTPTDSRVAPAKAARSNSSQRCNCDK